MTRPLLLPMLAALSLAAEPLAAQSPACTFRPGAPWLDTEGRPIDAHSAGLLQVDGTYYWYGESHRLGRGNRTGVTAYSSRDLCRWKFEGVVLPKEALPERFRDEGVAERPKVIRNARTGRYVMWMHLDADGYRAASAGVAVADSPAGPFRFLGQSRPIRYDYGYTPHERANEREHGNTFRDMNLFVDDDGTAYVIYASEENATLYVVRLNAEYTAAEEPTVLGRTWTRALPGASREAPAPFKHGGRYYMFTSGTTGWAPNPTDLAVADHPLGEWKRLGNPFFGPEAETSFRSQSTYVLPVPGKPGAFIYLGDRWNGAMLEKSTYVWLPFVMDPDGKTSLAPFESWDLRIFDSAPGPLPATRVRAAGSADEPARLAWDAVPGAAGYRVNRDGRLLAITSATEWTAPLTLAGRAHAYTVAAFTLTGPASPLSPALVAASPGPRDTWLSEVEPDRTRQGYGSLGRDTAILGSPLAIAGRRFERGLATHAPAEIVYDLGGQYARFTALVGRDDSHPSGSVVFRVFGDGRLLFESPLVRGGQQALPVDVSLDGVAELRLVVDDGGDGSHNDHADWAEARLLRR